MQVNRLFKVLVMGGAALTVGCTADDGAPGKSDQAGKQKDAGQAAGDGAVVMDPPVVGVDSGAGVVLVDGGGEEVDAGVGSWLHWF